MKPILNLLLVFVLVSCTNTNVEETRLPVVPLATKGIPTGTVLLSTPLPSATPPVELPCNPFHSDFCITDGLFLLQRPIRLPGNDLVDSSYRYASTADGTRDPHHGVEFANPSGTPVYAAAGGTVIFASADVEAVYAPWGNFYGNLVVVEHSDDLFTLYAHLSKIDVQAAQTVEAGQKLGEVGRTGVAIGSHLHFEVRRGNVEDYFSTQNPELLMRPANDTAGNPLGTLVLSILKPSRELVRHAEFTIQYYPDPAGTPEKTYYGTTYAPDMQHGEENAVLGELPAGHYRIAVEMNGQIYERRVEVEWGRLTQVVIIVK